MLPQPLPADQRRLLAHFTSLDPGRRVQLLEFAEFLASRQTQASEQPQPLPPPAEIERPSQESVIAAMRRLRSTYHMLDTGPLLDRASLLMSSHLLHGEPAEQVIDQLQELFEQAYAQLLER